MKDEYKSVLISIVEYSKRATKLDSISLTYLLNKLSSTRQNLESILTLLERDDLITIYRPTIKVTLIQPTIKGFEKALEWQAERTVQTPKGKLFSFGKVIGFSLFAVILSIVWSWMGFSTKRVEPLYAQLAPFKIYNQQVRTDSYYYVLNGETHDNEIPNVGGSISGTLDGKIEIWFEIESIAENHQLNIHSIDVELVRDDLDQAVDVEQLFPGLGGGEPQLYEVVLGNNVSIPSGQSKLVRAEMSTQDGVEYVYLKPGEREVIAVRINLIEPGRYKMTPIINYTFQDINASQPSATSVVYFPQKYRYSSMEYDANSQSNILTPGLVTFDTQSNSFVLADNLVYNKKDCMNLDKWISFSAYISQYNERLFVVNPSSGAFDIISHADISQLELLGWDYSGNLYFRDANVEQSVDVWAWNPASGARKTPNTDMPPNLHGIKNDINCIDSNWCLSANQQDTNADGIVTYQDAYQIVWQQSDTNLVSRLGFSNKNQSDPVLSPDKKRAVYVEGDGCSSTEPDTLYLMALDSLEVQPIAQMTGNIQFAVWSPDGKKVAFAANRGSNVNGNLTCNENTYRIHVVDLEKGDEVEISTELRQDNVLGWSSDSNWLLVGGDQLTLSKYDGSCVQVIMPALSKESNVTSFRIESDFLFHEGIIQP